MPTPKLFDFDADNLEMYEPEKIDEIFAEHPAVYLNHLAIARHLSAWARRDRQNRTPDADDASYLGSFAHALDEVAAHLRQGDYVPGGAFLSQGD